MVHWLGHMITLGCPGFKSCSKLWSGFVSGCPGFNSTMLCYLSTDCLLPVGVLNHVSVKFKLFVSDY